MKLRYQLRGLGVGMIFAALVMMIIGNDAQAAMSDAQVMERARQLGMVESDSIYLSTLQQTSGEAVAQMQDDGSQEEVSSKQDAEEAADAEASKQGAEEAADAEVPEQSGQEAANEEASEQGTDATVADELSENVEDEGQSTASEEVPGGAANEMEREVIYSDDPVVFSIENGQSSYTVSKNLYAQGLVKDVEAFDSYLIENGYSKSIRSGKYEIWPGTSEQELARMITGKY